MPRIPPIVERSMDENEKIPAPHNSGIKLPIVEPTKRPPQIKSFIIVLV